MHRTTSLTLLLVGGVLLSTRLISPASSAPTSPQPAAEPLEQTLPALADVNAEIDRLRDRLPAPSELPPSARDPFNFGMSAERTRSALPAPPTSPAAIARPVPSPALPKLVAILSDEQGDGSDRTAVLALADDVQFKKAGDDVGSLRIQSVKAEALVLVDPASQATFTLSLH